MPSTPYVRVPNNSQNTPLMIDGRLYISTGLGTAAALDATTGTVIWFDLPPGQPAPAGEAPIGRDELVSGGGASKRGLAYKLSNAIDPVIHVVHIISTGAASWLHLYQGTWPPL